MNCVGGGGGGTSNLVLIQIFCIIRGVFYLFFCKTILAWEKGRWVPLNLGSVRFEWDRVKGLNHNMTQLLGCISQDHVS